MKRLPRDDANAGAPAAVGGDRETPRGGGEPADRRAGAPGAVDEERAHPRGCDSLGGGVGGHGGGQRRGRVARAPPESPLWGSGEV